MMEAPSILHDVTPFLGELEAVGATIAAGTSGPDAVHAARRIAALASTIASGPASGATPTGPWVAVSTGDALVVAGPDFVLDVPGSGSISVTSDSMNWLIAPVESTEAGGDYIGGQRIFVSRLGEVVADWTFGPSGTTVDNRDFEAQEDAFDRDLADVIDAAIDASGIEADAPDETVSGEVFTESETAPASTASESSSASLSGAGAIGTIGTMVGGIAAREISRHLRRGGEAEADPVPAPWRPTHVVGADALPVGGVPAGTFEPGTALDPGLEVRLIETRADGWALVECSNTWRCYVAAWGLVEISR
jgi:hypothetical protein